jgi:DNA-directed RNA polymerase specialized sigma24 family protein
VDDPTPELRQQVLAGDADAFGEVFDVCARSVYNHAFRLTGDWSAAEDVMAMTFGYSQLLLSPASYQVIGAPQGAVVSSTALVRAAEVAAPGDV